MKHSMTASWDEGIWVWMWVFLLDLILMERSALLICIKTNWCVPWTPMNGLKVSRRLPVSGGRQLIWLLRAQNILYFKVCVRARYWVDALKTWWPLPLVLGGCQARMAIRLGLAWTARVYSLFRTARFLFFINPPSLV